MRQATLLMTLSCLAAAGCDYSPKPDHDGNIGSPTIPSETTGSSMAPADSPTAGGAQPTTSNAPK